MADVRFSSLFSWGYLRPEANLWDPYNMEKQLQNKIEEINTSRAYQSYWERVTGDFSDIWDTIWNDLNTTAQDTWWNPLQGIFTPVKWPMYSWNLTDTQFYWKTLPTAIWAGTRAVLSPLSWLFSWISKWEEQTDKGIFSEWLRTIWETFEWVQNIWTKLWESAWLENRYSSLLSEWVTNILTWEIWEVWFIKAFWLSKASKIKKINETRKLVEANMLDEIGKSEFTNLYNKDIKIQQAKWIMDDFHNKISNWDLSKTDLIQTKKELTNLWVKDTNYFTERWNDIHSSSTIKEKADEQILSEIDNIINKNKEIEYYKNPEKSPLNLRKTIEDIKKIEELGWYKDKYWLIISPIESPKINTAIKRAFKWDQQAINNAIAYKKELFKDSDLEKLYNLYKDNKPNSKEYTNDWIKEYKFDSEENPFKRKPLTELRDSWVLKQVQQWDQYSYSLTKKWEELNKMLWFTEEETISKRGGLYHHKIEAIDSFDAKSFDMIEILKEGDIIEMNKLNDLAKKWKLDDLFNPTTREWWVVSKTDVNDINKFKVIIKKINDRYKLWFTEELIKSNTIKELTKIADKINNIVSDDLINSSSFKPFKIKGISDTNYIFKNIPKDIVERVVEKTNFSLEKNRIINSFEKQINIIKAKYKNNLEKLSLSTKNALDKKEALLLEVRLKYKQFWEIKSERIKEFKTLARNWIILWNIDKAVASIVKNKSWNVITTVDQLKAQFEKLDKAVALSHTKWLQNRITKELNRAVHSKKSTSKTVRMAITPEIEGMLLEIKSIWRKNKAWYINIDQLNQLLYNIRDLKSKSREIAKDAQIKRAKELTEYQRIIKEEWITNLVGTDDITDKWNTIEKLKGYMWNWENASTFMYNTLWKIFWHTSEWKMSKWVEIYNANPVRASNKMNNWIEKYQKPLAQLIVDKLWPEMNEWWLAMLARQIDNSKKNIYVWLDRIENSPALKKEYLIKRESKIGKQPEWMNDDSWNKFKNTKLWEYLERMESDVTWSNTKAMWNEFHDKLFSMHQSVTNRHDWILMIKRQDYFKAMAEKSINEMQFDEPSYLTRASLDNSSANELVSTTKWLWIDYNVDPIKTLLWWDRSSLMQSFLRDSFEDMVQTHIGKQYKFKNISKEQRLSLLESGEWKITDKMWEENVSSLLPEEMYITNIEWWVRKSMNKSTDKLITEYIQKISKGWSVKMSWVERVVSWVLNQYTANTLWFSPSAILQQPLSLMHGMAVMWTRRTLRTLSDILNDSSLIEKAEQASTSIRSRKWDNFMFNDILEKTYDTNFIWKSKEVLRKYNEIALYAMRIVDEKTYASIWITTYREWMEKNWFKFDWNFNKEEAIKYADVMSDKIAGTTNKVNVPPLMNNLMWQILFKLMSTKINEWQTIKYTTLSAFKRSDSTRGLKTIWIYTASNLAQAWIVYAVAKALYWIWFTNYDPDKNWDLVQQIFSLEWAYDLTVGNSPIWAKASWIVNFWTLTMADSLVDNISKSIKGMSEGEVQWLIDFISTFIWKKPIQYTQWAIKTLWE